MHSRETLQLTLLRSSSPCLFGKNKLILLVHDLDGIFLYNVSLRAKPGRETLRQRVNSSLRTPRTSAMNADWQPHLAHPWALSYIRKPEGTLGQATKCHQKATENPSERVLVKHLRCPREEQSAELSILSPFFLVTKNVAGFALGFLIQI